MKLLKSDDLTLADLPNADDWSAIQDFAYTFDGYDHFGIEEATNIFADKKRSNLDELRCELFVAVRWPRFCYGFDDLYLDRYRDLYPLFQKFLEHSHT